MKKKVVVFTIFFLSFSLLSFFLFADKTASKADIKREARQASVQPMFDVPVFKVYFTEPLEEEKDISRKDLLDLINLQNKEREILKEELENKIAEAVKNEREFQDKERYRSYLTKIEKVGVLSYGRDSIILGSLTPKWARFPKRVITVYKNERSEVKSWENEEDIYTISESANVSPTTAKEIVAKLQLKGYSISKDKESTSEVKLLWFNEGWDKLPTELNWLVYIDDDKSNLISGYDPRGILNIRAIPEGKRVNVKAGYLDLYDEFKPKAKDIIKKEEQIFKLKKELSEKEKEWKEEIEEIKKELEEATKKEIPKRDISDATVIDVMTGSVSLERFWYRTAASGIFLGNKKVRSEMSGYQSGFVDIHSFSGEEKGFILTNAHVATMAINVETYVSKDKEVMWIVLPAFSSIRYTQDSDMYGSPAQILAIDNRPVASWDYDCAVMVTSKVPGYNKAVKLGDSNKVQEGDRVTMVGNPAMLQKFLTEGSVANTDYSLMKSHLIDFYLNSGMSRNSYNWILNTNFWFDTPIGTGGTSGSGVWAMSGSEKGKVIAIHHAGIVRPNIFASDVKQGKKLDIKKFNSLSKGILVDVIKKEYKELLSDFDYSSAKFSIGFDEFINKNPTFESLMYKRGGQELSGLNAGIKINNVKKFLQERGLDPKEFGWEKAGDSYWER